MVHWMPYPIWGWPVPLLTKGPAQGLWWRRRRWILDLRPPAQHSKDCLKPTGHQRPQTKTHGHRPSLDPTNWAKDTSPACKNGSEASEPFCHVTSKGSDWEDSNAGLQLRSRKILFGFTDSVNCWALKGAAYINSLVFLYCSSFLLSIIPQYLIKLNCHISNICHLQYNPV